MAIEKNYCNMRDRRRNAKGQFVPSKKLMAAQDTANKEKTPKPANEVSIKIVKEKKPDVPKNIVGKLNDLKERYASRFINSVLTNKPTILDIDGVKYYAEDYVKQLRDEIGVAESNEAEAISCFNILEKTSLSLMETTETIVKDLKVMTKHRNCWRGLALGLVFGLVIALMVKGTKSYVSALGTSSTPLTTTAITVK